MWPAGAESAALCALCGTDGGLVRRNLAAFYSSFMLFSRIRGGEEHELVCPYCWVQANRCIKFIERVRNTERILDGADVKIEPNVFSKCSSSPQLTLNICDQEECQNFSQQKCQPPSASSDTENASDTGYKMTNVFSKFSTSPQLTLNICDQEECQNFSKQKCQSLSAGSETENASDTSYKMGQNEKQTLEYLLKMEPDIEIPPEFDYRCFNRKNSEVINEFNLYSLQHKSKVVIESESKSVGVESQSPLASVDPSKALVDPNKPQGSKGLGKLEAEFLRDVEMELIIISKVEQLKELAQKKLSAEYLGSKYKCDKCGFATDDENTYYNHQLRHDELVGIYECSICAKRFKNASGLGTHESMHARHYRCLRCGETIKNRIRCAPHNEMCTGRAPMKCAECGKTYPTSFSLRQHIYNVHTTTTRYECDDCGRKFKTKYLLVSHMSVHSGVRHYQCNLCGKKFKCNKSLKCHKKSHGPKLKKKRDDDNYCVECDRVYNNKHALQTHLKTSLRHVAKDTFKFPCSECPHRCYNTADLKKHIDAVHFKKRTHLCTLCDKGYVTSHRLAQHMQVAHRKSERPRNHVCDICKKGFLKSTTLRSHVVAVHYRERPFACQLCPATFGFSGSLFTHIKLKHKKQNPEKIEAS